MAQSVSSGGSSVSARKIEKFERRLHQTEQSNRALLDELMRVQSEIKSSARKNQQKFDEERQVRQQMENAVRALQSRLAEAEERARRAETTTAETKSSLSQLVTHTRNVERAISNSQQGIAAKRDSSSQKLQEIQRETERFKNARDQLERTTQNLKNEIQDLKNKLGQQAILNTSLSKQNSDGKVTELHNTLQELQNKLKGEEKSRELLQQQMNKRNINEIENNLNKTNESVLQRLEKMEIIVSEMDENLKKTTSEIEKILAAEIQARRDQGKLLKTKLYEFSDNLRVGLATVQGRKVPKQAMNDVNWKLDALKVHQISEEAANQVRQDLEMQIKELQKQQKPLEAKKSPESKPINKVVAMEATPLTSKKTTAIVGSQLDQDLDQVFFTQEKLKYQNNQMQDELKKHSGSLEDRLAMIERRITARMDAESRNTNKNVILLKDELELLKQEKGAATKDMTKTEVQKNKTDKLTEDPKMMPVIVGSETDQRMDELYFAQEKLRKQNADLQDELNNLTGGAQSGSLPDRFIMLDRKVTARMDAETRDRNNDVKMLKEEIELLKKNNGTLVGKPKSAVNDDLATLKKDVADNKIGLRKMAESIQVVKTTIGEKLTSETKIRKQETVKLQSDLSKIKAWMEKNQ